MTTIVLIIVITTVLIVGYQHNIIDKLRREKTDLILDHAKTHSKLIEQTIKHNELLKTHLDLLNNNIDKNKEIINIKSLN